RASFDLHVLSTPPAFILSQDQTLRMTSTSPKTSLCLETCYRLPGTRPDNRVDHPTEMGRSPQAAYHVTSSYHSSVVKVPHFPRETKNRCKLISFASARLQARSLSCTVCPAHGGLNDLLADYTRAGVPVKGNWEFDLYGLLAAITAVGKRTGSRL